jgi:hypothetical protein
MAAISAMPQPYLEFAASSFRTIAKACPGAWFLSKCPGQLSQFSTEMGLLDPSVITQYVTYQSGQPCRHDDYVTPRTAEIPPEGGNKYRVVEDRIHAHIVLVARKLNIPHKFLLSLKVSYDIT